MRVVAGQAKGRKLVAPSGRDVRPTSDRVREALFSTLGTAVAGARVLDLFAGSGALGLEALSRGASVAVFVDNSRRAVDAVRRNLEATGFGECARVIPGDALVVLDRLGGERSAFDLVFLDPPYKSGLRLPALERLAALDLLAPSARVVAEHPVDQELQVIAGLRIIASKRYGGTALTLMVAPDDPTPEQKKDSK
ncbi:MAG: 16S rRNA (guanine(966)-N(2))-methyltransferase RsmD [Deltaproteobacteria bacterium]|nr:16S rRNA (guanine(966)-N(2))-methyltransferase RsmD [Deltaproteobacteria bacterium]